MSEKIETIIIGGGQAAGISTVIWAMGYQFDFSLVKLPVLDGDGFPVQNRGVTNYPGLFFTGLPWLYKYKSGHLLGVGEDAKFIAEAIIKNEKLMVTTNRIGWQLSKP